MLQNDIGLEKRLKQLAQENIPQQYTEVEAGSHIIDPGEKVTLRHIMMLMAMKNALGESRNLWSPLSILGSAVLSLFITLLIIIYLKIYHTELFRTLRKLTLLTMIVILTLVLAKGTEFLLLYKGYNLIEVVRFPLLVPFASLLLCVLLGARISLFISIFLSVILSVGLTIDYDRFLVLNLIASMCTIMFARTLHKRKDIFEVCGKVWLCCMPVLFAFNLIENTWWDLNLLSDLMSTFAFMTITAILVVGLLPLFESLFKVMTDMTLMEYMDPNNELLRRLSLEAPGTYQHCLVVGNLAEVAARAIGANDLFCRVATLYHDIGKLFNPHYFTENQLGGFNIHQLLTPLESTHVIIAHVPEGEILAKKYHLPQSFIDIIREHHGTTLVYYFYCKQIEQMEGDANRVNEKLFRYPGPKPHTKESALIMIADTVEAASRSLDEVTEEIITDMVNKLVAEKAEDGQFDECQLTFEELGTVKKAIVKALLVTRHLRIKYPSRS
jgi:cyclic-di-AMP phosphodiesterase PgpH